MTNERRGIQPSLGLQASETLTLRPSLQDDIVGDKDMSVVDFEDLGYPPLARQT
jgi:hypothetical protein